MDNLNKINQEELEIKLNNLESDYILTEKDFYPPEDTRVYHSGIANIKGGDNFADYVNWFYDMYEEEIFND